MIQLIGRRVFASGRRVAAYLGAALPTVATKDTINMDVETLYPLYVDYVQQLREALTEPGGPEISERFLIGQMSLADFEACWKRLGRVPGRQEALATKLRRGYETEATDIRQRLEKILAGKVLNREAA